MRYMKCIWKHNFPDDPVLLYSELDEERWEVRKVEVFASGALQYADAETSTGDTGLGLVPTPELAVIAQDPEFEPSQITREEFEEIWARAKRTAS